MRLVDVHCHLESEAFRGRLDEVLAEARAAGIITVVTSAIVPEQWALSQSIAERFAEVEFTLGVHPWYAKPEHAGALGGLAEAKARGAVAIGEIGLDRKAEKTPFDLQRVIFREQLAIAVDIGLPVVLHCRGAFNELIEDFKEIGVPAQGGVMHNFSGSPELAHDLMRFGMRFSLGGTLTYRNSKKKQRVLEAIYPGHFLLETDSPDIPPVEARGKPNVPANILHNLRAAAETLGEDEETIAEHTTRNALEVFGLA